MNNNLLTVKGINADFKYDNRTDINITDVTVIQFLIETQQKFPNHLKSFDYYILQKEQEELRKYFRINQDKINKKSKFTKSDYYAIIIAFISNLSYGMTWDDIWNQLQESNNRRFNNPKDFILFANYESKHERSDYETLCVCSQHCNPENCYIIQNYDTNRYLYIACVCITKTGIIDKKTLNAIKKPKCYTDIIKQEEENNVFKKNKNKHDLKEIKMNKMFFEKNSVKTATYFEIHYYNKDKFKELGGNFDNKCNKWYIKNELMNEELHKYIDKYIGSPIAFINVEEDKQKKEICLENRKKYGRKRKRHLDIPSTHLRKYFDIPYDNKDYFKQLGGKFDKNYKKWYIENELLNDDLEYEILTYCGYNIDFN